MGFCHCHRSIPHNETIIIGSLTIWACFEPFEIELTFHRLWLPRNSIPGPDHLSTLSTTIELLQLLLPEDSAEVIPDQEDDGMEGESLKRTTEISISAAQMRTFLKFDSEDGPFKTLEKRLEVRGPFLGRLLFVVVLLKANLYAKLVI